MKCKINELMAFHALLASTPFIDSDVYADIEVSELNPPTITHIRAINYDQVVAENTTDCETMNTESPGWWSKYLC